MFTIEVPSRKERMFLNRLQNACFIQVKARRTDKDEISVTLNVFR